MQSDFHAHKQFHTKIQKPNENSGFGLICTCAGSWYISYLPRSGAHSAQIFLNYFNGNNSSRYFVHLTHGSRHNESEIAIEEDIALSIGNHVSSVMKSRNLYQHLPEQQRPKLWINNNMTDKLHQNKEKVWLYVFSG